MSTDFRDPEPGISASRDTDAPPVVCPVCGGAKLETVFEAPSVPAVCNALFETEQQARDVPRGELQLVFCPDCGHMHNATFDPARVPYGPAYENSLHHSPRFESYARALAQRLVDRYDIRNAKVLEIACGNGEFLAHICQAGDNRGIGFDPSGVIERAPKHGRERIEIVADYFRQEHAKLQASLICCRHALEHVPDPRPFLHTLRSGLAQQPDTIVYFEVPNGRWILDEHVLWDLIYEHCGYFTRESLVHLFASEGFDVLEVGEDFGRQFLWIEARPAAHVVPPPADLGDVSASVRKFANACTRRTETWRHRLASLARRGSRVGIWGAGSKGVTFLNLFRDTGAITHVVDLNPHKHGMRVAGTGHPIRSPDELGESSHPPDVFVVMNPVYIDEIRAQIASLGLTAECIVA